MTGDPVVLVVVAFTTLAVSLTGLVGGALFTKRWVETKDEQIQKLLDHVAGETGTWAKIEAEVAGCRAEVETCRKEVAEVKAQLPNGQLERLLSLVIDLHSALQVRPAPRARRKRG